MGSRFRPCNVGVQTSEILLLPWRPSPMVGWLLGNNADAFIWLYEPNMETQNLLYIFTIQRAGHKNKGIREKLVNPIIPVTLAILLLMQD